VQEIVHAESNGHMTDEVSMMSGGHMTSVVTLCSMHITSPTGFTITLVITVTDSGDLKCHVL